MGLLFVIAIIWVLCWLIGSRKERERPVSRQSGDALSALRFRLTVNVDSKTFGDLPLEVFVLSISGPVIVPHDNYSVRYLLTAMDITDGDEDPKPLLCALDELQLQDSKVFAYQSPPNKIPYRTFVISESIQILAVPVDTLIFPAQGRRRIKFIAKISSASTGDAIVSAEYDICHDNPNPGYLDSQENQAKTEELAVQLAVAVSAIDGELHETEGKVVQTWVRKRLSTVPDEENASMKSRLNAAVSSAFRDAQSDVALDMSGLCGQLVEIAPIAERYDILKLCMKVVSADGTAKESELEFMQDIARMLDVNLDRFRAMSDKIVPVTIHEVEDVGRLLSIPPNASTTEKKEHLRKEYRKWNMRVAHSDPDVRKQATKMLDLIATARSSLDS